jgi:hypothetical protein
MCYRFAIIHTSILSFYEGVGIGFLKIEESESEGLKIEEPESELLCTDSTALTESQY